MEQMRRHRESYRRIADRVCELFPEAGEKLVKRVIG